MNRIKLLQRGLFEMVKCWPQSAFVAAAAAAALFAQGCAERTPRAYPWATAIYVRPHLPAAAPGYKSPSMDVPAPDLPWDFAPAPKSLLVIRQPARPHVAVQPAPEPAEIVKTDAPLLAPQLSEQETAAAQQQMNDSIAVAQRNLTNAKSNQLSATQTDLASKVNSFIEDSKAAAKDGDWTRAKNLAKKAQVLSEELAQSL
jgi:hypothetical protein